MYLFSRSISRIDTINSRSSARFHQTPCALLSDLGLPTCESTLRHPMLEPSHVSKPPCRHLPEDDHHFNSRPPCRHLPKKHYSNRTTSQTLSRRPPLHETTSLMTTTSTADLAADHGKGARCGAVRSRATTLQNKGFRKQMLFQTRGWARCCVEPVRTNGSAE